jgi:CheY-like chemotaxis protein
MFRSELVSEGKADIRLKYSKKLLDSQALLLNDELRFTQIMTNLLNNAIKFTDKGEIEFGYEVPKNSEIIFFVSDTGIGIPESKFESIFELFRQGDGSFTRKYGGTGLGLSISKRLANLMGGNIWVESTEGKGSTFYFKLPYDESVVDMFADDDDEIKLIDSLDLSNKTILVVDDTIDVINYLQILLKNTNVNFLFATSGMEAIELYIQKQDIIDIILMDIQMPEMDGMQVTRKIREINNEVIIVAQTAFALAAEKELFMQVGCNDFIAKPIEDDRLIEIFQKYLFK